MAEKITEFTRENMKMLRPEIQAVLDMIKDEYGVNLSIGTISFSEGRFTTRMTGTVDGYVEKKKEDQGDFAFGFAAKSLGLPENCRGRAFPYKLKNWTVDSIRLSSTKYPVICRREDGKKFKFTAAFMKRIFETFPLIN